MDPTIIDAISKVGFPIVAAVSVAGFLAIIGRWFMSKGDRLEERLFQHLDRNDEKLNEINPKLDKLIEAQPNVCRAKQQIDFGKASAKPA